MIVRDNAGEDWKRKSVDRLSRNGLSEANVGIGHWSTRSERTSWSTARGGEAESGGSILRPGECTHSFLAVTLRSRCDSSLTRSTVSAISLATLGALSLRIDL